MKKCGLNLAFTGTIKDEILDTEEIAFFLLKYLISNYLNNICEKYNLDTKEIKSIQSTYDDENQVTLEVLEMIGKNRGCYVSRTEKLAIKRCQTYCYLILEKLRFGKITLEYVPSK